MHARLVLTYISFARTSVHVGAPVVVLGTAGVIWYSAPQVTLGSLARAEK